VRTIQQALTTGLLCFCAVEQLAGAYAQEASPATIIPLCHEAKDARSPDHMVRPKYPKEALNAGLEGSVELQALVGSTGKTTELKVVKGDRILAKPALEAVRKWRFLAECIKGVPVETTYRVKIRFVLVLREAIPSIELESPREPDSVPLATMAHVEWDAADGRVYRYTEGSNVIAPKQIYSPEPEFSEVARRTKEQGTVGIGLIVGIDGTPRSLHIICSSAPDLNENALNAVKMWRFTAGTKDDKPVAVELAVEVKFTLDN